MMRLGIFALAGLLLAACASQPSQRVNVRPEDRTAFLGQRAAFLKGLHLPSFFDCLRTNGITIPAAHRLGGRGLAENTFDAMMDTTVSVPARSVVIMETDVRQTEDGALVVMHDETVDRTTRGTGRVDRMGVEQFKQLQLRPEAGSSEVDYPPVLGDLLAIGDDYSIIQLDVKRGVSFEGVVTAVQSAGAQSRVIVIVYSIADAITVHNLDPALMLSVSINSVEELDTLVGVGVDLSRVLAWTGAREPRPALYQALRGRGVEVLFGTLGPDGQSIDSQIEKDRNPRRYVEIAKSGVTMIATGRYRPAYQALVEGGVGDASRCVRA
jgi:glycerophosphoryl diester phosphodiesterase